MENKNNLLNSICSLAKKREEYCKNAKPCPKCGTNQIQLIGWGYNEAEWKCRFCKHRWIETKILPELKYNQPI